MGVWVSGCVGVRLYGCMGAWLCMDTRSVRLRGKRTRTRMTRIPIICKRCSGPPGKVGGAAAAAAASAAICPAPGCPGIWNGICPGDQETRLQARAPSDAPGALCLNEVQRDAAEALSVKLFAHDSERGEATIDGVCVNAAVGLHSSLVLVIPDERSP